MVTQVVSLDGDSMATRYDVFTGPASGEVADVHTCPVNTYGMMVVGNRGAPS